MHIASEENLRQYLDLFLSQEKRFQIFYKVPLLDSKFFIHSWQTFFSD